MGRDTSMSDATGERSKLVANTGLEAVDSIDDFRLELEEVDEMLFP